MYRIALIVVSAILLAACGDSGSSDSDAAEAPSGDSASIVIADFNFGEPITVEAGTEVTVTNSDSAAHTWTTDDHGFDSGTLNQDGSFTFVFTEPGEYLFHCDFHIGMTGSIIVE
ncbi:MAG: cupredoxin domain-containing protein [Acidimicrobiales bacterium]